MKLNPFPTASYFNSCLVIARKTIVEEMLFSTEKNV